MLLDKFNKADNVKKLMLGGVSAALLASSSVSAHATTINLAVAANFYNAASFPTTSPIGEIITAFVAANPSYSVVVVDNGSTGTLVNHITTGNTRGVDLLLAADTSHPIGLYNNYNTLVAGIPFEYAIGVLAFWSTSVDVTCGTGTCGYSAASFNTAGAVVVADTVNAPYGTAAKQLLTGRYGIPSVPSTTIVTSTNIDTTYAAVANGTNSAGFVALSAICSNGSYPASGYAYAYQATEYLPASAGSTSPTTSVYDYAALIQDGIKIAHTRTADQETELTAFIAYLTDYSSSTTQAVTTLKKYCYQVP